MALTEAQIIDLLNDPSNDDFYRYATDLKNRLDSERGFAIELNKKFPDVDTTSHHRIYKIPLQTTSPHHHLHLQLQLL